MTADRDIGQLPEALTTLVAAEHRAPAASAADRARVWAAITPMLPPPGGGSSGPSGSGQADPSGGSVAPAAKGAALARSLLPWIVAVVAIGGGAILYATRKLDEPPRTSVVQQAAPLGDRTRTDPSPAGTTARSAETTVSRVTPPPDRLHASPVLVAPTPAAPEAAAPEIELSGEGRRAGSQRESEDDVIERARISLARSRFDEALALLTEHEKRFPAGSLRGERELLIVRALLGMSNRVGAQERAAKLHRDDPGNPSLPAIDAALAPR